MPHKQAWGQARPARTLQREAEVHGEGLGDLSPPVPSACLPDPFLELDVGEVHPQLLSPLLVVSSLGQHQCKSSVLQKARADLHPVPAVGHSPFPRAPSPAFTSPFTEPISFIAVAILRQVYVALVSWTLAQSYPTRAETSTRWLPAPQQLGVNIGVGAGSSPFHSTIIWLWLILPYDTMPQDISLPSHFKSLVQDHSFFQSSISRKHFGCWLSCPTTHAPSLSLFFFFQIPTTNYSKCCTQHSSFHWKLILAERKFKFLFQSLFMDS